MAAAHAGAALAADGVDLIDEDDARAVLLGLFEQVTNTGCADTDEHLDEVRTGDGEERHPRLTGDGPREQRLTCAGRTVEQHALGDLGAERLVAGRVLQEVLDLVQFLDGLVGAGDVGEGGLGHVLGQLLGLGSAEVHHATTAAALHAAHHEEEQTEQDDHRQQEHQDRPQHRILGHVGLVTGARRAHRLEDERAAVGRVLAADLVGLGALVVDLDRRLQGDPQRLLTVVDLYEFDVLLVQFGQRNRGVDATETAIGAAHRAPAPQHQQDQREDGQIAENCLAVHSLLVGRGAPPLPLSFPSTSLPHCARGVHASARGRGRGLLTQATGQRAGKENRSRAVGG